MELHTRAKHPSKCSVHWIVANQTCSISESLLRRLSIVVWECSFSVCMVSICRSTFCLSFAWNIRFNVVSRSTDPYNKWYSVMKQVVAVGHKFVTMETSNLIWYNFQSSSLWSPFILKMFIFFFHVKLRLDFRRILLKSLDTMIDWKRTNFWWKFVQHGRH